MSINALPLTATCFAAAMFFDAFAIPIYLMGYFGRTLSFSLVAGVLLAATFLRVSNRRYFKGIFLIKQGWPRAPRLIAAIFSLGVLMALTANLYFHEGEIPVSVLIFGHFLSAYLFLGALSIVFGPGFAGRFIDRNLFGLV